tara:strand:- start:813 stop:1196 length:384 start_codon:yes stop_codon:yes gene_type:complete
MRLTAYISGPMSAFKNSNLNEPAFRAVQSSLEEMGYNTIVPHDIDPLQDQVGNWEMHMRADLIEMLAKADFVVTVSGDQFSEGKEIEMWLAAKMKMPVVPHCNVKPADQMFWPEGSVLLNAYEDAGC